MKNKPTSLYFPTFSQHPNTKHQAKKKKKTRNHVFIQRTYQNKKKKNIYIYFPLLSHVFSPPKHEAPSKVENTKKKNKKENGEEVY